ncbi:AraC family transcriptional regulator [Streptomyces eurythermus]|uniref:AraC family transcriptional regulator n=1 Tax=Streptomyces eurythermus TaxID=42237 RepID=UPI0033CFA60D
MSPEESIDRPDSLDPLEDVLALVGTRATSASTLTGRGEWALRFPAPAGAKFNSVVQGTCTLTVAGHEPLPLRAGDSFLLTSPAPFALATSPAATVQPASPLFRGEGRGAQAGPATAPVTTRLVGASFRFAHRARRLLLDPLPPVLLLPAHADGAAFVQQTLGRIERELDEERLGARQVAQQLALVMLVDLLRHHASTGQGPSGWLRGLDDPVTATALRAIHADPARRWSVRSLAETAHVSRSTLAARFKKSVGQGPVEYLTRWRLELAAHRLITTDQPIAAIAQSVGYGSETALGLAFKREFGTTPGAYRRTASPT